ncbi:MBL fold metallo-hydrolase [Rhodopseudomonas sp. HC1]|uniref:MBL fold metallo-hydrolase n=1 Tax=Rhodopseudomonas infernalis TaxID=2897386 RepID=UPI001EE7C322|nr:MBL fold metallo-hydrolase [Rhodopseudomonas infernalis]MCG6207459.1 MBL fold metallo-hydrolase [Rhodopseudomonas infernalis]
MLKAIKAIFLVVSLSMLAVEAAPAAAPQVRTQAPGYYRMMLGQFEITALLDGTHPFPVDKVMLRNETDAEGKRRAVQLSEAHPGEAEALLAAERLSLPLEGAINAFLINTGDRLVLIDSGAGSLYGDCCGHLIENLRAAGYKPEQVDEIYLTHLHADHVGGVAPHGRAAFPNAIVRVNQRDVDYWLDPASEGKAPAFLKSMFEGDRASLKPYQEAGRLKPFKDGEQLSPGIRAVPTAGHTPGHTSYEVGSGGQRLLVWGDLVHVAPIQFRDPAITLTYDSDPFAAQAQRSAIFADAATTGTWIAAAHIAFPGIGHIVPSGTRFAWIPASYTTLLGTK